MYKQVYDEPWKLHYEDESEKAKAIKTKIIERANKEIAVKAQYITQKIENRGQRIEQVFSFHENNSKQVKNRLGEHVGFIKLPLEKQLKDSGLN